MKNKRIFAFTLILALFIGMFSAIPAKADATQGPVNLIYAKPVEVSPGAGAEGYIKVKNISQDKKVTIRYSYNNADWFECAASYYKPAEDNYEIWKFVTPGKEFGSRGIVAVQFTIKFEANGQTYWDDNNGKKYCVAAGYVIGLTYAFGIGAVANVSSYIDYSIIGKNVVGTLQLKNLGQPKTVKVIYTTDNWATTKEANAEFGHTAYADNSVEEWYYTYKTTSTNIQYKLSYTVNGVTYIDDNFGDYYTVTT